MDSNKGSPKSRETLRGNKGSPKSRETFWGLNNLSIVGLAKKAGKTLIGTAACESGIWNGRLRLLLLQQSMSESSIRKFKSLCDKNKVDVFIVSGYDGLGRAVGNTEIRVVGITDDGFANKIKSILSGIPEKL